MDKGERLSPPGWWPSGYSAVFICDVVSFSAPARHDRLHEHLRKVLYRSLRRGFEASGIPLERCYWEDRGDGAIIVPPAEVEASVLLWPLVDRLRGEIRDHNAFADQVARIGLRVVVHEGPVKHDGHGLVGAPVIHASRLLDAEPFKERVRLATGQFGVIVSSDVYDRWIRPGGAVTGPEDYARIRVRVKETEAIAWMRVPEGTPAQVDSGGPLVSEGAGAPTGGALAGPNPVDPADQFTIAQGLVAIAPFGTPEGRDQLITALPGEIATRISRRSQPLLDMHSILVTCSDFPGGFRRLLELARAIGGESRQMRELDVMIARLMSENGGEDG